jgi:hypothetical protein
MPRAGWVALALVTVGFATPVGAQPLPPAAPVAPDSPPLRTTPITPAPTPDRPLKLLGAPVGPADTSPQPTHTVQSVAPVAYSPAPATTSQPQPQRAAAFGAPSAADSAFSPAPTSAPGAPVPTTLVDEARARTAYQPPPTDLVNDLLTKRSELRAQEQPDGESGLPKSGAPKGEAPKGAAPKFGPSTAKFAEDFTDKIGGIFGGNNGNLFRSDHLFDGFISPVTNPFLFEDPRSLTEVRPIFIYQKVPSSQGDFHGGSVSFFGAQGRVAFTDQWSLVVNKFGGVWVNTNSPSPFRDTSGFAELWLGPKWTFYRGEETASLAAAGLQFQIPTGSHGTFQNTGSLALAPYLSYGTNFLRDFSAGSFNFLANTGFSFSTNNQRSDYYWLSGHLDMDIGNLHRFYPLFELNWLVNTSNGHDRTIGVEGRDLLETGGQAKGSGLLTGAFGGRIKITESAQLGGAFEFPFWGRKDLFRYRFTIDFILRY